MAYKALTESQIVANLIDTYSSLATVTDDFNKGSVLRSVFEAFAQELKRYYQNSQERASEIQKIAAYTMFNFPLNPAVAAYTLETITVSLAPSSDVSIPAGVTFQIPGTTTQYQTVNPSIFPSGATSTKVRIVCTQVGSIGKTFANTITQLLTPISGLPDATVTNDRDVRNGADLETDDERANRFQQWINSLHAGDVRALVYGATTAKILDEYGYIDEQVTKAQVVEGSGSNTIYIDNGFYDASNNLVTECQKIINGYVDSRGNNIRGYKSAGIPTTVEVATNQSVTLTVSADPKPGYTFAMISTSISDVLTTLVQSLNVGETLTLASINLAVGNTPGVFNFQIDAPSADIVPTDGTLLKLGIGSPTVNQLT